MTIEITPPQQQQLIRAANSRIALLQSILSRTKNHEKYLDLALEITNLRLALSAIQNSQ